MTSPEVERAVRVLRAGGLVAFPTETVYGLGADAGNPSALRQLYAVKRRPARHPVIVHLAAAEQVDDWAADVPDAARILAGAGRAGANCRARTGSALPGNCEAIRGTKVCTGGEGRVCATVNSKPFGSQVAETNRC